MSTITDIVTKAGNNTYQHIGGTLSLYFELADTFGDGWNGNVFQIFTNTDNLINEYDKDKGGYSSIDTEVGIPGWTNISGCTLGNNSDGESTTVSVSNYTGKCTFEIKETNTYYLMIHGGVWDYEIRGKVYANYGSSSEVELFDISMSGYSGGPWIGILSSVISERIYDGDDVSTHDTGTSSDIYIKNSIPVNAFKNNLYLKNIYIDNSVTSIGANAFDGCTILQTIQNFGGVTQIDAEAFKGCVGLEDITLPNNITTLGEKCFMNCENLVISLGSGISTIPASCFKNTGISTLIVPSTINTIENNAFNSCQSLDSVIVYESTTNIGNGVFKQCPALSSATIYFSGSIPDFSSAFASNFNIAYMIKWSSSSDVIPDDGSITGIEYLADVPEEHLKDNTYIVLVVIGTGCTSIGNEAFLNCSNLSTLVFDNDYTLQTIGISAFKKTKISQNLNIPYGVTTVGDEAFSDTDISQINFPTSCTSVGARVANKCSNCTTTSLHQSLTLNTDVFNSGPNIDKPNITKFINFYTDSNNIPDYITSGNYFKNTPTTVINESTNMTVKIGLSMNYISNVKIWYYYWSGLQGIRFTYSDGSFLVNGTERGSAVNMDIDSDEYITNVDVWRWAYNNAAFWGGGPYDYDNLYGRTLYLCLKTNKNNSLEMKSYYYLSYYYKPRDRTITTGDVYYEATAKNYEASYNSNNEFHQVPGLKTVYSDFVDTGSMVTQSWSKYYHWHEQNYENLNPPGITNIHVVNGYSRRWNWPYSWYNSISGVDTSALANSVVLSGSLSVQQIGEDSNVTVINADTLDSSQGLDGILQSLNNATMDNTTGLCTFNFNLAEVCPTFYKGASFIFTMNSTSNTGWYTKDNNYGSLKYIHTDDETIFNEGEVLTTNLKTGLTMDDKDVLLSTDFFIYSQASTTLLPHETVFILKEPGQSTFKNLTTLKYAYIHKNCSSLAKHLFKQSGLIEIFIPETVTSISEEAFADCPNLQRVVWDNSNITEMPKGMFKNCPLLNTITINGNITTFNESCFEGCSTLLDYTIPPTVTTIGNKAFKNSGLTSFTIPSTVNTIGVSLCENCTNLESLTIGFSIDLTNSTQPPGGISNIPNNAFKNCSNLTSVTIPYSITGFGGTNLPENSKAFWGCSALTDVHIAYGVSQPNPFKKAFSRTNNGGQSGITFDFEYHYFGQPEPFSATNVNATFDINPPDDFCANHTSLSELTIAATVTSIGARAFQNSSVSSVSFEEGTTLTHIGEYAFEGATNLTTIALPSTVETLGNGVFKDTTSLTNIILSDEISDIPYECFKNSGITEFHCPPGLITIGESSFESTNVTELDFSSAHDTLEIATRAFKNCSSLKDCVIPSTMNTLHSESFTGCSNLHTMISETNIGICPFSSDGALDSNTSIRLLHHIPVDYNQARRTVLYGDFMCEAGHWLTSQEGTTLNTGSANLYKKQSDDSWLKVASLATTETPQNYDSFGMNLAMKNGWLVIGAWRAGPRSYPDYYNGMIYLYKYNPDTDTWGTATSDSMIFTETQKIKPQRVGSEPYGYGGYHIVMNSLGYLCVSERYYNSETRRWGSWTPTIYTLNTTTNLWELYTTINVVNPTPYYWNGSTVPYYVRGYVMNDDYLLVHTAWDFSGIDYDEDGRVGDDWAGGVYVFKYDSTNKNWTQIQKLLPSKERRANSSGYLGISDWCGAGAIDISENNNFIVIGYPRKNTYTGEILIYNQNTDGTFGNVNSGGSATEYVETSYIEPPSHYGMYDYFGFNNLLSGNILYVGNPYYSSYGNLIIYSYSPDTGIWSQETSIVPSNVGYFGWYMDKDGTRLAIANYRNSISIYHADAANILGTTGYTVNELANVNVTYENALAVANHTLTSNTDDIGDLIQMSNINSNKRRRALKHLSACIFENNRSYNSFIMSRTASGLENIANNINNGNVMIFNNDSTIYIDDISTGFDIFSPLSRVGTSITLKKNASSVNSITIQRDTWSTYTITYTNNGVSTTSVINKNDINETGTVTFNISNI